MGGCQSAQGGLILDVQCRAEAAWPGWHQDVPLPSPMPPAPAKPSSGGTWEVNPGVCVGVCPHPRASRGIWGPRRVPQLRRCLSLPWSGILLPKTVSKGIRQGDWRETGGGGESIRPVIAPRWCLPSPEPKRGLKGSDLAHNALYSPSGKSRCSGSAGACRKKEPLQPPQCAVMKVQRVPTYRHPPNPASVLFWGQPPRT